MPGGLNGFSKRSEFFVPLNGPKPYEESLIGEFDFTAIGRLKPGVDAAQVSSELNVMQAAIAKEAASNLDLRATLVPLQWEIVGPARQGLLLLLAAVAAVLLMICLNLANLLLARVPGRMREAGIRNALGANRAQLLRPMLTESLVLTLLGGFLGVLVAMAGVQWLVHTGPTEIPRLNEVAVDARALGFLILATLVIAAGIGAVPGWLISRTTASETLTSASKSVTESRKTRRLHATLVGTEVAVCTVLLIVAGLLSRSMLQLLRRDLGYTVERVLTANIELPSANYKEPSMRKEFFDRALERIRSLPGVQSAAWVSLLPLQGQGSVSIVELPGHVLPLDQRPMANYRAVSPDYFHTMGIPLIAGRGFTEHDHGMRQVIVSQGLASRLWPNQNPVGQQVVGEWGELQLSTVIGVAGDVLSQIDREPLNMVYVVDSWAEVPARPPQWASIVVATSGSPVSLSNPVRSAIREAGPDVAIAEMRPMTQLVALNLEGRRFQMTLTSTFAISALVLASLGIFGVLAYSVERRQREFGIRAALGARHSHLLAMVFRQGLVPVALGLIIGGIGIVASGGMLQSLLFGVKWFDPLTFAEVSLVIAAVGALACYVPARHAMAAEPVTALRSE